MSRARTSTTARRRQQNSEIVTLAQPPLPVASGDLIADQYTIDELYGAGPLGYTYRAIDVAGSAVAVKVIARELAPTANERNNVVAMVSKIVDRKMPLVAVPIDVGIHGNVAYVVTPWVRGRSLRRILGAYRDAGREMPREEVRGVLEGVVQALRQLHAVTPHGALYPESIQVSADGKIILTDAGIASSFLRARWVEHLERYPDVFAYLAPEVRLGKASNAGGDLYGVGALASELLTGSATAAATGIATPTVRAIGPGIDAALKNLTANRASRRAAALPALLSALAKAIERRSLPLVASLPVAKGRTDVIDALPTRRVPRPRTKKRTP